MAQATCSVTASFEEHRTLDLSGRKSLQRAPCRVRCPGRLKSTRLFDFAERRRHKLAVSVFRTVRFSTVDTVHASARGGHSWRISENSLRENELRRLRSSFGALGSPEEYKKLDSSGTDVWL